MSFRPRYLAALPASLLAVALQAHGADYDLVPGQRVVGTPLTVRADAAEGLLDVARRHKIGYEAMRKANPTVDMWLPENGEKVVIPSRVVLPRAKQEGIVINRPEMRLFHFSLPNDEGQRRVAVYPIGIGRSGWATPLGIARVISRIKDPGWSPPASIRREHAERGSELPKYVPPGPDNPLGQHALRLSWRNYLIHGTNRPRSIGMEVSHGCVRMYPEDIETLYNEIRTGTPVQVVEQPLKAAWYEGTLYLEAHTYPTDSSNHRKLTLTQARQAIEQASTPECLALVDWNAVQSAIGTPSGMPTPISVAACGDIAVHWRGHHATAPR